MSDPRSSRSRSAGSLSVSLLITLIVCIVLVVGSLAVPAPSHDLSGPDLLSSDRSGNDIVPAEPSDTGLPRPDRSGISYDLSYTYGDGDVSTIVPGSTFDLHRSVPDTPFSHPLPYNITTLAKGSEIAIGNHQKTGNGVIWVFDDLEHGFREIHSDVYPSENLGGSDMVTGDIDGDGLDELIISSEVNVNESGMNVSMTRVAFHDDAMTDFQYLNSSIFWITSCSLAVGDFDGDGRAEVTMVGKDRGNLSMGGVVLDDILAVDPVHHIWDPDHWGLPSDPELTLHHAVTSGDLDGDGRDEIATVGYVNDSLITRIWSWNDEPSPPSLIHDGMRELHTFPFLSDTRGQPSATTGEIDGDPSDELIISTHDLDWKVHHWIFDDNHSGYELLREGRENLTIRSTDVATGDVDGDGIDEILLVGHQSANLVGRIYDDALHGYHTLKVLDYLPDDIWFYWFNIKIETGDVDGDGVDEYVMLGQSYKNLYSEVHDDLKYGDGELLTSWLIGDNKLPSLAIGEFDRDGLILEYSGHHRTIETPLIPFAAIAAPPVSGGVGIDPAETYTRFGHSRPEGVVGSHQLDIQAGLLLSFEGEPIELTTNQRSAFLSELDGTNTPVMVTGTNISFQTPDLKDHILYQNTFYEQYTYRIVSWPGHADRANENMSILVPVSISISHMPIPGPSGNETNETLIGIDPFGHILGDLTSYPDLETRNATTMDHSGWVSGSVPLPIGPDEAEISVELPMAEASKGSLWFGTQRTHFDSLLPEFDSTTPLIPFPDHMYTVMAGIATVFEGKISFKDGGGEEGGSELSIGMFGYFVGESDQEPHYLVIDYWVEGNTGPGPGDNGTPQGPGDDSGEDTAPIEYLYLLIASLATLFICLLWVVKRM